MTLLADDIIFLLSFLSFSIALGIIIFHVFLNYDFIDGFYESALMTSGIGYAAKPTTSLAKGVIGIFAIYSGIFFLATVTYIITKLGNIV